MLGQILVSPAAVSGSAGFDTAAAGELGTGAVSSAPVISTVLSPGMDPTSLLVQAVAIQRAAVTLMTLAQFSGQRAFYAAAKEFSSASFSAIEGINTAAAMI